MPFAQRLRLELARQLLLRANLDNFTFLYIVMFIIAYLLSSCLTCEESKLIWVFYDSKK